MVERRGGEDVGDVGEMGIGCLEMGDETWEMCLERGGTGSGEARSATSGVCVEIIEEISAREGP